MYTPHPSQELTELFSRKPFQGAAPQTATFLFIGLDANYDPRIAASPVFPYVRAYHDDGVAFWRTHGVHHRFLFPGYSGDGRVYHRNFGRNGFKPEHAPLVSFVELLHIPTVGRNVLAAEDLHEKQGLRISGSTTSVIPGRRGIARPARAAMS
jgi:hypothetical protein